MDIIMIGLLAGVILIFILLTIVLNVFALQLATRLLEFKKHDFKTALVAAVVNLLIVIGILLFVVLVSYIGYVSIGMVLFMGGLISDIPLFIYLIKRFYGLDWRGAFLVWVLTVGIIMVVQFLMSLVVIPIVVMWQLGVFN